MTTTKQKPPHILCIGKWTSLALTAEIYGFELNEPKRSTSGMKREEQAPISVACEHAEGGAR